MQAAGWSITSARLRLLCWNHDYPFAFGLLNVALEVGLGALPHLLEVALVEVSQHCDAAVQALHVLLEVEAVLGELRVIRRSRAEQDGLFELFVELGDACAHLFESYGPFFQHLHVLLALDGRGQPVEEVRDRDGDDGRNQELGLLDGLEGQSGAASDNGQGEHGSGGRDGREEGTLYDLGRFPQGIRGYVSDGREEGLAPSALAAQVNSFLLRLLNDHRSLNVEVQLDALQQVLRLLDLNQPLRRTIQQILSLRPYVIHKHTDLVLVIDLLEVYLVELVIFVEHLPDVRLADLLEVKVEGLAVEAGDEGMEEMQGGLEVGVGGAFCEFGVVLFLERKEVLMPELGDGLGHEGRMQFRQLALRHLPQHSLDRLSDFLGAVVLALDDPLLERLEGRNHLHLQLVPRMHYISIILQAISRLQAQPVDAPRAQLFALFPCGLSWLLGGERDCLGWLGRRQKDVDLAGPLLVEDLEMLRVPCLCGRRGCGGRLFDDECIEAVLLAYFIEYSVVERTFHEAIAILLLYLALFFLALEDAVEQDLTALAGDQALVVLRVSWLFALFLALEWGEEAAFFIGYSRLALAVDVFAEFASSLLAARQQIYLIVCLAISKTHFSVGLLIDELLLGLAVMRLLRLVSFSFLETLLQAVIEGLERLLLEGEVGYLQKQVGRGRRSQNVLAREQEIEIGGSLQLALHAQKR